KEYSARAVQLQRDGKFAEARRAVSAGRRACGGGEQAQMCHALFYYTAGYIHQKQSSVDPRASAEHLRTAAQYYRRALRVKPDHGPTLSNFAGVLKRLGQRDRAIASWRRAIESDPSRAAKYLLLIGDTHLEAREWDSAQSTYREAIDADPDADTPMRRLVEVYRRQPNADAKELAAVCAKWAARAPEVAVHGFATAIALSRHNQQTVAEAALVHWGNAVAATRSVSASRLRVLPAEWEHAGVKQLHAYLEAPWNENTDMSWWVETDRRRAVVARLALAIGNDPAWVGKDPKRAEAIWRAGLAGASEDHAGAWELQTALAMHYHKYPHLDPRGRKFRRIERDLFSGKMVAYTHGDDKAIQRFHTILGLIYADRGQWTSGRYENAIFQLSAAIDRAGRRPGYQPLAQLKSKLAGGYLQLGKTLQARLVLTEALKAYLDTDDLDRASETYQTIRRQAPPPATGRENKAIHQLSRIIVARKAAAAGHTDGIVATGNPKSVLSKTKTPWLYLDQGSALDSAFLDRQRFKIVSDVAAKSRSATLQLTAAAEATQLAGSGTTALVGTADILRIEKANTVLRRRFQLPKSSKNKGKAVPVYLPSGDGKRTVQVDSEGLLAGAVVQQVGADTLVDQKVRLQVSGNQVTYSTDKPAKQLGDKLRATKGIGRVQEVRKPR
ncbi:MAG: tetratricopeptide repeat protein, partial [bacterium]|nr:tetratricopeptide repeat protein [bacterium]